MFLPESEKEYRISLVRLLVGDIPISVFYPILTDTEYAMLLAYCDWDVNKAARRASYSILFYLTQTSYRERTGDIEVWNNASIEYRKALNDYLDNEKNILPEDLRPWTAGANPSDVCRFQSESVRSPLAQISACSDWWTRVDRYDCISDSRAKSTSGFRGDCCGT